ncbi:dTDP-4-dehydrorhamnose 3,5-epimerase [Phycisphaera mikurensis]|uniref:dTDP-4-dehydrorhamnose 3,5-epimerase n=1 Tax=Phycisphaera mikurensis (strain NBRC 102666 / KCTC 22515 / FYK2301M01) TaxID=1142394 RepID=I0IBE0_PHYMF|nr:dTDP-4-dehydrorhamnose 3,5-epimerase [Phycisphaera mikurensis]MBB6442889.1 dTDP-4-dehydrorhamnose 3,5-epimerase [Phycisphaera mikurensis]BAM02578.1 dTDP-4-dehydrorhamnose 3,5-epimerase [Phycisphaera mikurensis NBRC 102666]
MHVTPLSPPGLLRLVPPRFGDGRGWFCTVYAAETLAGLGIGEAFVQDSVSFSERAGTVRGLHFQRPPHGQGKLVRVVRGRIRDVSVDLRVGSPAYGEHAAVELAAEGGEQVWVPPGFAHGFVTLEDATEVHYKSTAAWAPASEGGLAFDCPALGIDWGVTRAEAVLSERDRELPGFAGFESPFRPGAEAARDR